MAPILPGLSDRPEQLAEVVKAARDMRATHVWCNVLFLRPGMREHFLAALADDWPELLPMYERLYARGAYLKGPEATGIREQVAGLRRNHGVADRRVGGSPRPGAQTARFGRLTLPRRIPRACP